MYLINNDPNHDPLALAWQKQYIPIDVEDGGTIITALEQLMLRHLSKGAHILDIGCLDGEIVKHLNIKGYQTTGLDVSEEFLRIARKKAPESKFILCDIRKFESPPTYDAVYSHNSFSFLLNLEELTTAFRNVYMAMHDNGLFGLSMQAADCTLFDGPPDSSFTGKFNDIPSYQVVQDTFVQIERHTNDNREERIREIKMTRFALINGIWKRSDVTVVEKHYFISEIKSALENAGFIEIDVYDSRDFGDTTAFSQPCFVCRKPSLSQ
ncbi:class I SAM-dependent methyltransferase [Nostoc sp. CHAB 5715]|uniref:class I SAM-dependent DNA methyltransferase n=1 Tax=Nostoc sp. CHAB 5715 TaxID=2780400 RepID=UPI001E4F0872|nr:class I SAM-dependent methyltransferase [Nostoc sp. CHAB 5715]MCC5623689.1 class I SAM-dependent methyltransferase [Nostoc sp. CHAB 5715]